MPFKVREMVISMDFFYHFACLKHTQPFTVFPIRPIICSLVCREPVAPNRTPNKFGGDINDDFSRQVLRLRQLAFETILASAPWTMQIMQSFRRLKKLWSRRNMFPDIILIFIYKCDDCLHNHNKTTCRHV